MGVRQYIGARYVPKFYENSNNTSEWQAGVIYEPLTIVTYNGNSYTSKKPVPANIGDPSSNTEYWVATGLYNEQVESLRQQFEELKNGIVDDFILFPTMNPVNNPCGHCMVITHNDHAMLVDMGRGIAYEEVKAQLKNYGIEYIDIVIISHYHGDHDGNGAYDRWKEDFNFDSCVFYLPLNPPSIVTGWESGSEASMRETFTNCTFVKPPYSDIEFYDYDIEVFNCEQADFNYYNAQGDTNYNTYSSIVRVAKAGVSVTNMADATNLAQERQLSLGNFKPSTIATAPHHGLEGAGSRGAADVISPQYLYITDAWKAQEISYRDTFTLECIRRGATVIANTATYPNTCVGSFNDFTTLSGNTINTVGHYDARAVYYVNENVSTNAYQDGTQTHPFKSLLRALSAGGIAGTEINLLSDITSQITVNIMEFNGFVYLKGGGHSISSQVVISRGAHCEIENVALIGDYSRIGQGAVVKFGSNVTWNGNIEEAILIGSMPTHTSGIYYRNSFVALSGVVYTGTGTISV